MTIGTGNEFVDVEVPTPVKISNTDRRIPYGHGASLPSTGQFAKEIP